MTNTPTLQTAVALLLVLGAATGCADSTYAPTPTSNTGTSSTNTGTSSTNTGTSSTNTGTASTNTGTASTNAGTSQPRTGRIDIFPAQMDFAGVPYDTRVTQDFQVFNQGEAPLALVRVELQRGTTPDLELVHPPPESVTILPGESVTITLAYTPGLEPASGEVVFTSDDPDAPAVSVEVTGHPLLGDISVEPSALDFGAVEVGDVASINLVLTNDGEGAFEMGPLLLEGSPGFSVAPSPAIPPTTDGVLALRAGEHVAVTLRYSPTGEQADEGALTVESVIEGGPSLQVPLVGEGIAPAPVCAVVMPPSPLDFGAIPHGEHAEFPVTVTNEGTGACRFEGASAAGVFNDAFRVASTSVDAGALLQPGEQATVTVAFDPGGYGDHNGTLTLGFTDPNVSDSVVLCGLGEMCAQNPDADPGCSLPHPQCGLYLTGTAL